MFELYNNQTKFLDFKYYKYFELVIDNTGLYEQACTQSAFVFFKYDYIILIRSKVNINYVFSALGMQFVQ